MKFSTFLLTLGVFVLSTLPALAQQDIDAAYHVLNQQAIYQNQSHGSPSKLYEIRVEISTYGGRSQTPELTRQATEWVYCSLNTPYIAFEVPDEPDLIYLSYLNPGGEINGNNVSTQEIYWKVCHNRYSGNAEDATALGYHLNLPDGQLVIPKVMFSRNKP
jgi:hypothetical protein